MAKKEKLLEKLRKKSINAKELRTLLKQCGWILHSTKGSHEQWRRGKQRYTLATHNNDLKAYTIRDVIALLKGE